MALVLKSLLKDPKLRSGVKALTLILSFFFFPLWMTGILASLLYLFPASFIGDFFGTLLALGVVTFSFIGHAPLWIVAIISSAVFFLLLGVKNVYLPKRAVVFSVVSGVIFAALAFGVFARFISLPLFAVAVFLVAREGLRSFTTLSQRANSSAAVISLILSEIAWVIGWLGISAGSSAVIEFIFAASAGSLIYRHLRGEITNRKAIFWSSALAVVGVSAMLLAAFK